MMILALPVILFIKIVKFSIKILQLGIPKVPTWPRWKKFFV